MIIFFILILYLIQGLMWISGARSAVCGGFNRRMLSWIKNTNLSSSAGIYAVFFIHKWIKAILVASVPFNSLKWFVLHMGVAAWTSCAVSFFLI